MKPGLAFRSCSGFVCNVGSVFSFIVISWPRVKFRLRFRVMVTVMSGLVFGSGLVFRLCLG